MWFHTGGIGSVIRAENCIGPGGPESVSSRAGTDEALTRAPCAMALVVAVLPTCATSADWT